MSYLRAGYPLSHVDADSSDYVFPYKDEKGKEGICDYGKLSDTGIVELFAEIIREQKWLKEKVFCEYLLSKLAERLNVKLRDKPLEDHEFWDLMAKRLNLKREG
ncbi:MAG: hypothetical protein PHC66_01480 [Candidatus Nanoarchaeia archaeon]|nr:hypothetical protein [Candidatus Nanoarchaeia archaeon]MDD5239170.1 hypothetical protein [Candidatus Nanoarchaeia archaeon]